MSSLSTLPKGDSAWLLRKSIQRIMQQVSVLETNIGSSTTGNSANTQVIFNDNGTLRGDTGLTFNKTTDTLGTGRLTTSGDAIVCSSTGDFYVGTTLSPQFKVERATGSATITGDLTVDTNVLKVDTTNDRVGINTTNTFKPLTVQAGSTGSATINQGLVINSSAAYGVGQGVSYSSLVFSRNRSIDTASLTASVEIYGGNAAETSSLGGFLGFRTQNAAGALTDRYTIDNTGISTWYVGGSTAMTLNSTGLGVGVTPSYKLHVVQNSSNRTAWFEGSNTLGTSLMLKNTSAGGGEWSLLSFGSGNAEGAGNFGIANLGGNRFTIDSSGNVGVGVTPSASGGCLQLKSGITFPATQVASSDANTLDDYEEGTFTATLKGGTADPTTPVTTTGRYTKIGRLVSIQLYFNNVNTTGASGSISVSGLPFSSASSIYNSGSAVSGDMATFTGTLGCWLPPSSSTIDLLASVSNGSITSATHNAGASRYLAINIEYAV